MKGLRGTWDPLVGFPVTPQDLITSNIESFMLTMGCKDNKLYNKDEQGLVLNFTLNGLNGMGNGKIARVCEQKKQDGKNLMTARLYI